MNLARQRSLESSDEAAMPSVLVALHCLRVAITVFDSDERLIFANEHFSHLFRALPPREELVGMRYEDIIRLEISGGDVADANVLHDVEGFVAYRRSQLFAGDYAPRDVPLADGRIIEIKTRRTKSKGWIALWSDVTQARHNLNRLQATIALSADAFAFYDRNDKLALCNEEYAEINGARTPAELIGTHFRDVAERLAGMGIANIDIKQWLERRIAAHRVPAGAMTVELAGGKAYLLRDRATSDGGRVVVFTDATEHCRCERALEEQTKALADTQRALAHSKAETKRQANYLADLAIKLDKAAAECSTTKTTLLRTMSHELKTPLNAIIGFSDLLASLADHATPDQIREYSGLVHEGGKNLLRLLNQILDLTKISAGRYELRRQKVDASLALWHAKEPFEERAEEKKIKLDSDGCPLGLNIDADETAFGAMLHQLIDNAVTFTQEGGEVRLRAARSGNVITVTVSDNGPGVVPQDLERILEPFEQGGRGATEHHNGAGLGLTLVRAFCELHGGALKIESAPGQGFAAIIEMPSAAD